MLYALSLAATRPLQRTVHTTHAATYCTAGSDREAARFGDHIARLLWPRTDGWGQHSCVLSPIDPADALPSRVNALVGFPDVVETRPHV